ncbi:MAG: hypothetical protein WCZ18_06615 [Ottowia sp.]|nr:hypothetical protein [Ottowia sp.]
MWDFNIRQALGLMWQTLPFLILRLLIYFGITLGYILLTGIGAGVGWGIGALGTADFRATSTFFGGFIGFGIFGTIAYLLREYILYIVKAGHIAVLVRLVDGGSLPEGRTQVTEARQVVQQRFGQASTLFVLDQLIKGVVGALTGLAQGILSIIPGLGRLAALVRAFLRVAIGFVDELILAYVIRTNAEDPWTAAKDALILYGQNYRNMFKNAAWLAVFVYVLAFLVFLVMLAPAGLLVYLIPGAWSAGGVIFALLFAWSVKVALLEPFAITCMMQVYFRAIEGQQPNAEWDARLEQMSGKFRKLKDRALAAGRGQPDTGASMPPAAEGSAAS